MDAEKLQKADVSVYAAPMPRTESLDELIARKAVEFADQMKSVADLADKEEEIRIEVEKRLAFIQHEAGIKLEGKHEFTVASGRVDSVYQRVIIEYKNPSNPGTCISPKADAPGRGALQIPAFPCG